MSVDTITLPTQPTTARTGATSMADVLRSRLLARLMSPVAAILPWWITIVGLAKLSTWRIHRVDAQDMVPVLAATALLLVASALWALVTAWSSTGPVVAGLCAIVTGSILATRTGQFTVSRLAFAGDVDFALTVDWLAHPAFSLTVGSLLLAAGLGAAGARRLGR